MKIIKTANGRKIEISKSEWKSIGTKVGWVKVKEAQSQVTPHIQQVQQVQQQQQQSQPLDLSFPTDADPSTLDLDTLQQENMASMQKAEQELQKAQQKSAADLKMLTDLIHNPNMEKAQALYQSMIKSDPELAQYIGITEQEVKAFAQGRRDKLNQFNVSNGDDDQAFDDAMAFNDKFIDATLSLKVQNILNSIMTRLRQSQPQQAAPQAGNPIAPALQNAMNPQQKQQFGV